MRFRAIAASFILLAFCAAFGAAQVRAARDARIQRSVDDAMARAQGSVVVLDVETGRLIAQHRMDAAARRLVRPGSAIKPFTLMALLEAGVVRPATTLLCRKTVRVGGRNMDCVHPETPEPFDGSMAIAYSCNYFFVHMAEILPPDMLAKTFRDAGLASRTGLTPNEVSGVVQRPATRETLQLMAVGEDSVQVTPLGLASAYRRLALRVRKGDPGLDAVVEGMTAAVQYGTGQLAQVDGMTIAGKTGTSPSPDRLRTYAWFAGFAPADRPEIAVLVFLEQGSGGSDAAPIAGRIFEAYR